MAEAAQALVLGEYVWIVVLGSFAAFLFGYGTGSNDVANAFGTSVGSKTLTLAQAVVIAIIFEFTGAMVLGRVSQETVAKGIADISAFQTDPEFFALGMMWALMVGGVWQIIASTYEVNVSATHSIIGAVVGFAMAYKGAGAVMWAQEQVVCSGPLTFISPCNGLACTKGQGRLMYKPSMPIGYNPNNQYLNGVFTVDILDVFNTTTGLPLSGASQIITVPWLSAMTGLNITLVSENVDATGRILNASQPQPVRTPFSATYYVNLPGYGDPLSLNATERSVFFTLKTARKNGQAIDCGAPNCPIYPQKNSPVVPYQMMYETKAPFCTTHSNANAPFPPYKGVLIIVLSWFFSPVLTGIASSILFNLSRTLVLRHENAYKRSFVVLPLMVMLTFWINIFFVLTRGAAKLLSKDAEGWTVVKAGWISAAVAGGASFFSLVVIAPVLHYRVNTTFLKKEQDAAREEAEREAEIAAHKDREEKGIAHPEAAEDHVVVQTGVMKFLGKAKDAAMHGLTADVFAVIEDDPIVAAIHKNAEIFDEKAELVFSYLQVFSAICVIFAHGAGEVGYMSGPLGAIWQIVRSGQLLSTSSPPIWTVVIGALGLVIGLGTYGYQVTGSMGCRLAKLTPSRGFCAELATSLIIMVASQYGLPTSSSQCITGGIIGVGLCEGKAGLNFRFLMETFSSWIITMFFMAAMTAFMFASGAFAPSVQASRVVGYYEEAISVRTELLLRGYQSILGRSGYLTNATGSTGDVFATYLAQTITNVGPGQYYNYAKNPPGFYPGSNPPAVQSPTPWQMIGYLDTALALLGTVVAVNPYGLMMCSTTSSTTSYETNPGNFPWYKSMATSTPSRGPCTNTNSLTTPLPPVNAMVVPDVPSVFPGQPGTICIQQGAPLPVCTTAAGTGAGEQNVATVFASLAAARATVINQYTATAAEVTEKVSAFSASYLMGKNVSISLVVPSTVPNYPSYPEVGTTLCVLPGAAQPPVCTGAATEQPAATAIAAVVPAFDAIATVGNAAFSTLSRNAAAFTSVVNNVPIGTYRSNVFNAINRTFSSANAVPRLTLATFVGPNPNCPPAGATIAGCVINGVRQSRFVNASGVPVDYRGDVDRLFNKGRDITRALSISTLSTIPFQGHVTLDQLRNANPGTSVTIFGRPDVTAGGTVCMQAPCNVAYQERPWFNGR